MRSGAAARATIPPSAGGVVDVDPHWYREFFGEDWLEAIALRIPEERTRQEVDFVVSALGLAEGHHVLDVPCGLGATAWSSLGVAFG